MLAAYLPALEQGRPGQFVPDAYKHDWVLRNFDWPEWGQTSEARNLFDDQAALADASPEQVFRLLTVVLRRDHFCEGTLDEAFESGLILRIVRRAAEIVKAEEER